MAVQSSTTTLVRALVMLVCVVVLPLVALFGTSLPEWAEEVGLVDRLLGRQVLNHRATDTQPVAASALQPVPLAPSVIQQSPQPGPWFSRPEVPPQVVPPALGSFESPVTPPPGMGFSEADRIAGPVVRAGYETPDAVIPQPQPDWPGAPAIPAANAAAAPANPFEYVGQRLRELGATYYLLELWGDEQKLHRFYCRMAVGGNPNCTRYFEATDADALTAMVRVLQEVEVWRSAGS